MASIPALVEPNLLIWARESAGMDAVGAARKMGLPDDRVQQWEAGSELPTIAQLKTAARVYSRSLAVFYLDAPPEGFDTLRDFRRMPGGEQRLWSPELHAEYHRAHDQRDALLEIAELAESDLSVAWRLDAAVGDEDTTAATVRSRLLEDGPLQLPRAGGTPHEHLNAWTAAIETAGVLVMSTKGGRVATGEMRAFSLYFDVSPVIVVNGADSPRGRLFSLLHEYSHLILHSEGLCDAVTAPHATTPNQRLEARCNNLAARILMPRRDVLREPHVRERLNDKAAWDYTALRDAASRFGVSAEAFLLRLVSLGRVAQEFYVERRAEFAEAYERDLSRGGPTGGNWYYNAVRDLGKGYVRTVTSARQRSVIDGTTAARYLDAKVGQLDRLAQAASLSR